MYEGFLELNNREIANAARTKAYVQAFMPSLEFKCDEGALAAMATTFGPYSTPVADGAPWIRPGVPESQDFYGFYPSKVDGGSDSTHALDSTELIGEGGVFGLARNGSLETRWTIVGFAKDTAAMEAGMTWLKDVVESSCGISSIGGCPQPFMRTLKAPPRNAAMISSLLRTHYNVGMVVSPTVTVKTNSKAGVAWHVTFTMRAGIPWGFASAVDHGTLQMASGYSTHSDPAGQNCSLQTSDYKNFINDPFFTAISLPPQPPVIKPPNLIDLPVWRRKIQAIPPAYSTKGAVPAPIIKVTSASVLRQARMRFYSAQVDSTMSKCNYAGEFYLSYLPAGSSLTINCATRTALVTLANGAVTSGTHLLFGSDGNPFMWPDLECDGSYSLVVDMMPPSASINTGVSINLKSMARD